MVDSSDSYESAITSAGSALAAGDAASLERAEALYRHALTAGERAFGADDLTLLPALTGLGSALILRNRFDEAQTTLTRAITIGEQLGADHPDFVILLNDLTRLYLKQGAHQQAEPLLQRLLEIKRAKGEDHPEVATVLASLASVRQTLGRYEEAEQLWRRVIVIRERTLAPNHFAIATAIEHLGNTCAARGKVHEALELFQRALTMRELSLGAEHASLRPARERIADLQLQASEDSLESSAMSAAPVRTPVIPRISIPATPVPPPAPTPAVPAAPAAPTRSARTARSAPPVTPRPEPVVLQPEALPVAEREPEVAKVVIPVSTALTVTEPAQPPAVPYMNVLMDIKDEFEDPDAESAPATAGSTKVASIAQALRERRPAAIAAAVAVIALPLTALGLWLGLSAKRGPAWVTQSSYASTPARDTSVATPLPSAAALGLAEATRDSSPAAPAHTKITRQSEPARRVADNADDEIRIPVIARPAGRLDSVVRAINVPSQTIGESYAVSLQASLAAGGREAVSELQTAIPARRATLIGRFPVPRYPTGLATSGIGGEVRVRFDVDTLGRPIMNTFTVVKSPHPSLSTAVKNVVPTMRFEPARTQGPVPRTITESVEQSFTFTPRGENNDGASGL